MSTGGDYEALKKEIIRTYKARMKSLRQKANARRRKIHDAYQDRLSSLQKEYKRDLRKEKKFMEEKVRAEKEIARKAHEEDMKNSVMEQLLGEIRQGFAEITLTKEYMDFVRQNTKAKSPVIEVPDEKHRKMMQKAYPGARFSRVTGLTGVILKYRGMIDDYTLDSLIKARYGDIRMLLNKKLWEK